MRVRMTLLTVLSVTALAATGCHQLAGGGGQTLPPAQMMAHPGPGVDGPGPGVMMPGSPAFMPGGPAGMGIPGEMAATSHFAFIGPDGMAVTWDVGGIGQFDSEPLIVPGRQNFQQNAIYRLKLTNIPGRPGVELYPTLEVGPATPRTTAYLQHNAIPVQFTEEDLDQVLAGNFVTKVIYLPDPEFQELALANVETLVSTRLDPGIDPVVEADRRGAILAIIRLGNKDLEVPGGVDGVGDVMPASHNESAAFHTANRSAYGNTARAASSGHGYANPAYAQAGYGGACQDGNCYGAYPGGVAGPPPHLAGVTTPQWGMPMSGTPIGLAGPPHVPLGSQAGLQSHIMKNRTRVNMPKPVRRFKMSVKQTPGYSYPSPVSRVRVREHTSAFTRNNPIPGAAKRQCIP